MGALHALLGDRLASVRFIKLGYGMSLIEMGGCRGCRYSDDLKGCASKHVGEAIEKLSEGETDEATENLENLRKHLKED